MFREIVVCFLLQSVFTVGSICLFGFLIAQCNRRFYANFGRQGKLVCRITGLIGTPVHEASHALMCLIFGHKIVEIKLFSVGAEDGVLGYVSHTYNKRNFYQRAGNFFIGVAPIVVISLLLALIARLLLPEMFAEAVAEAGRADFIDAPWRAFGNLFHALWVILSYCGHWQWWIFLLTGLAFCLHMTLSKADIRGAVSGVILVLVAFLSVDVVLALPGGGLLRAFTRGLLRAANFMICFLMISLLLALIAVAFSFLLRAIRRASSRRVNRKESYK